MDKKDEKPAAKPAMAAPAGAPRAPEPAKAPAAPAHVPPQKSWSHLATAAGDGKNTIAKKR
jgi:hypothetical protein